MKNILKVLLVAILAVATVLPLVACGGGADVTTPEVTTPDATTPDVTTPEVTTPEETTPEEAPVATPHEHNDGKYIATVSAGDSAFGKGYEIWGCTEAGCGFCEIYFSDEADGHSYVDGVCSCAGAEKAEVGALDFKATIDTTGEWAKYEDAATGLYFLLNIPKFYDFENTFFGEDKNDAFTTYLDEPLNVELGQFVHVDKKPFTITEGSGSFADNNGAIISFTLTMNAYTTSKSNSQFMTMFGLLENGEANGAPDYVMMMSPVNDDADPSTPYPKSASGYKNTVKFELGVGSRVEYVFTPNEDKVACQIYVDGVLYADCIHVGPYRSPISYLRIGHESWDANKFDIDDLVIGKFVAEDSAEAIMVVDTLDFSKVVDHDYTDVINGFIARSFEYAEGVAID